MATPKKQKVLVCGASGFIGRNVAESLARKDGFEVHGTFHRASPSTTHPAVRMVRADLTNPRDVNRVVRGKDIIIQAAATTSGVKDTITRPYYHVTDNAVMNSLIFRAAHEHRVSHLVFFSCSVMYHSSRTPVRESDFDAAREIVRPYFGVGWTKVYLEKMCEFYSRLGVTRYTVARHSNIYGPHDKFDLEKSHVLAATLVKVMNARDGRIVVWGTGKEERDLLYVTDLVRFVEAALSRQTSKFGLFNVGSGTPVSVSDLAQRIIACSGRKVRIEYDRARPAVKTRFCLDTSRARRLLGWSPKVSLNEGIRMTLDWLSNQPKTAKTDRQEPR